MPVLPITVAVPGVTKKSDPFAAMLLHLMCFLMPSRMTSPAQLLSALFNAGSVGSVITAVPPAKESEYPLWLSEKWLTNKRYSCPTCNIGIVLNLGLLSVGEEAH